MVRMSQKEKRKRKRDELLYKTEWKNLEFPEQLGRRKGRSQEGGGEEDLTTLWAARAPGRNASLSDALGVDFWFAPVAGHHANLSSPTFQASVKSAAHKCCMLVDVGGNQRKGAMLGARRERPAVLDRDDTADTMKTYLR